jgi:cytochrome b561
MSEVVRYHPLLVTLHWMLAALIIGDLAFGFLWLAATPDSDPQKIGLLRLHMAGGVLLLVLMIIRFIVRVATLRPAPATTGHPLLDRSAPITHYGLYVLVVLMVGTGFATAILSGLNIVVFGPPGARLPPTLTIYPTFVAHVLLASLLASLIGVHVLAALYHQWVRKDALLRRMLFGQRAPNPSAAAE